MEDPKEEQLVPPIQLVAKLVNGKVEIQREENIPKGAPRQRFQFQLRDETNLNVRFCAADKVLDVDESDNCPPRDSGIKTDQVDPRQVVSASYTASFIDKNSGNERTLCYALNFECNDPAYEPRYDPIIINGGQQI